MSLLRAGAEREDMPGDASSLGCGTVESASLSTQRSGLYCKVFSALSSARNADRLRECTLIFTTLKCLQLFFQ